MERKTKVLIVDDSSAMRMLLKEILSSDPDLEVVGAAHDPLMAREMIKSLNPDVLTLDVEMPRMDGLTFLEKLMRLRPMPVVMISSLTQRGCETTLEAMSLGAVDFVAKPTIDQVRGLNQASEEICRKVKSAAKSRVFVSSKAPTQSKAVFRGSPTVHKLLAIGASTGGTEAIMDVLRGLPADIPPTVIVQHIPAAFSDSFSHRLNDRCAMIVKVAENDEVLRPGTAYLGPGDFHLEVQRDGSQLRAKLTKAAPVSLHRPSVDVLFDSVSSTVGGKAIGVILTGMGSDGASGMRKMRDKGARTIAQDEKSCVVFGMPARAIEMGGVQDIVPLSNVAGRVLEILNEAA